MDQLVGKVFGKVQAVQILSLIDHFKMLPFEYLQIELIYYLNFIFYSIY